MVKTYLNNLALCFIELHYCQGGILLREKAKLNPQYVSFCLQNFPLSVPTYS